MALSADTKLGPYRITDQIGGGGMGEVYRATDTRLDRTVAIKVLRQEMADNRERRERFEREAKAISSLNHPHICTLYDVGEQDGTYFLVMEFVEGQTLEQRLQRGRLPLDQALEFAVQIADALDKAHRHGVVHRDLKPGNIMITRSGVKLLDFGLAKLTGDKGVISPMSQMPTQASANLTADGAILGTLQYMAPEQLEGKDADNRTDIFAFGGVVYEMVTGQKAFNGTSHASLIGAIMTSEPQPMTAIQEMTPASLDHIVLTCLAKDPEDRWQTARDLMRELRRVGTTASPNAPVSVLPMRSRGGNLAKFAIAAIAGALLASGLFFLRGPRQDAGAKQASVTRLTLPLTPIKSLNTYSLSQNFAISPDGRKVVFTDGAGSLWVRDLQEDEATDLRGTECRGCNPVFSPDGEWIAYFSGAQLAKVSVHGGAPVTLCDSGEGSGGISWGPDGYIVFALAGARNRALMRVHENGGKAAPLLATPVDADTRWPFIIDGGRAVIFSSKSLNGQNYDQGNIQLFDLETKQTKVLLTGGGAGAQITADGHLIFARATSLMAVPFDAKRREVRGQPVSVLNGVAYDAASGAGQWSVSTNGTLVFVQGSAGTRRLMWVGAGGQSVAAHPTAGDYYDPRLSPSGDAVAAELLAEGDDIWVFDLKRQVKEIVSSPKGEDETPAWSPDGQRVAWATGADNERVIIERRADGSADPKELWHGQSHVHVLQYTPDGRSILFETESPNAGIWILPLDGSEPAGRPLIDTPANEALARVSPNGQWIAYVSDVTGAEQIYVEPFPGRGPRIPVGPGAEPVWARDGRRLYYRASGAFWAVDVSAGNTFTPGAPVRLFDDLFATKGNRHTGYDVAGDGRLMVVGNTESERQVGALKIIQNWLTEVEKRAPAH